MKLESVDNLVNAMIVLDRFIGPPGRIDTAKRLIKVYYDNIHNTPIQEIPDEQAIAISHRLYMNAVKKLHPFRHIDREILRKLAKMQRGEIEFGYDSEERMCILMENYADDNPIVLEYNRVTGKYNSSTPEVFK